MNGSSNVLVLGVTGQVGKRVALLTHAPDHPEIAEAAGISLQLSGQRPRKTLGSSSRNRLRGSERSVSQVV